MELSEEDKKFLEEKFGNDSNYSQLTEEDLVRYKKINKEKDLPRITNKTYRVVHHHKCTRCGYEWKSYKIPKTCANPKCKSPYWNKERQILKRDKPT